MRQENDRSCNPKNLHFIPKGPAAYPIPRGLHLLRWSRKIHYVSGSRLIVDADSVNSRLHNPHTIRTPSGNSEVCLRKLWERRSQRSSLNLAAQLHDRSAIHAPSLDSSPPTLTISFDAHSRRTRIPNSIHHSALSLSYHRHILKRRVYIRRNVAYLW